MKWLKLDKNYKEKILFEINQIDKLISNSEHLFSLSKTKTPDFIESSAIALTLHSFYNGIENIFVTIIKSNGDNIKPDLQWHRSVLDYMFSKNIIQKDIQEIIEDYMGFRHFIRHSYGFQIKWQQLAPLAENLIFVWETIKDSISDFIKN